VTRLVVVDAVLLALVVASVAWVSRVSRGSRINLFNGRSPGWQRPVGAAVGVVVTIGLVLGTAGYGSETRAVNFLTFLLAYVVVVVGGQVVHNRAVDRR